MMLSAAKDHLVFDQTKVEYLGQSAENLWHLQKAFHDNLQKKTPY